MNITLPDGRKATVINQVNDKMVTIRFEDGRETMWPIDKLPKEKEGEDTLKLVKLSALETLDAFQKDKRILQIGLDGLTHSKYEEKLKELRRAAAKEFIDKWGLT